ncbi:MAG: hypothetical protein G3M78_09175 [Candidatus Nitrohelix vancouverensis]|uniref:Uncharacterized protein n=1 Tax=Candidatus Nitrohelix vancouverensis TaxID=2705534 RepID=A0A7T0G3P9_9BACT|nr:MAG: hypothetical protein G3M78_09175 [Candidatus Nitrohelix vancouverensis]
MKDLAPFLLILGALASFVLLYISSRKKPSRKIQKRKKLPQPRKKPTPDKKPEAPSVATMKQEISQLVENDPDKVVQGIRMWLNEEKLAALSNKLLAAKGEKPPTKKKTP